MYSLWIFVWRKDEREPERTQDVTHACNSTHYFRKHSKVFLNCRQKFLNKILTSKSSLFPLVTRTNEITWDVDFHTGLFRAVSGVSCAHDLLDFLDERIEIMTLFDPSVKHLSFISLNLQALSMLCASPLLAVDRSKFGNRLTHWPASKLSNARRTFDPFDAQSVSDW